MPAREIKKIIGSSDAKQTSQNMTWCKVLTCFCAAKLSVCESTSVRCVSVSMHFTGIDLMIWRENQADMAGICCTRRGLYCFCQPHGCVVNTHQHTKSSLLHAHKQYANCIAHGFSDAPGAFPVHLG